MNNGTIQQLNILLKKNYDTLRYYQEAASLAGIGSTHEFFNRKANERQVFGRQIMEEIDHLGGKVFEKGDLDHLDITPWFQLKKGKKNKSKLSESQLMQECQQAETKCLEDYRRILAFPSIAASTRKLLQDQLSTLEGVQWDVEIAALLSKIEDETLLDDEK